MPRPDGGPGGPHNRFLTEEEKKNAPKITGKLLKRIFSYLTPYWKQLIVALAAIILTSFLSLYPSVLTGRMIDEGLIAKNFPVLVRLIIVSLAVLIASNLVSIFVAYVNAWIAQRVTFDMRNNMFRHLQQMSTRFFTSVKQGDIITRMTSDIDGVQSVISNTFSNILSNVATLVIALIAMFEKNWLLALIGLVIVPLFTLPTKYAGQKRWSITLESQKCNDEVNQILNETMSVSGQMLVKLFTTEDREYEKYEAVNFKRIGLNIKETMAGRWLFATLSTFTSIGPMLIYLVGGALIIIYGNTELTVGDISVMVTLLTRMYRPVDQLLNIQVDITRSMAMFSRIFEYFDMPIEIKNKENALAPADLKGTIEFEDVHFAYNPENPILRGISFSVPEHRCVAVVGSSGAGKSTLVNLIPRLYDTVSGTVKVGGYDVKDLDLKLLRSSIGMVTQDTYLFNGTIRDNLLYAKPDATEEELITACKKAHIHDFIAAQPDGYDTLVGNRGLKLSGGEKQRVSIARVILKDPKLLIFDEATSALDSISESAIQEAIEPLLHERTSLVIAHRLSTILSADEILVLSGGHLEERGSHSELIAIDGVYKQLYETQFKKAIDDAFERRDAEEAAPAETVKGTAADEDSFEDSSVQLPEHNFRREGHDRRPDGHEHGNPHRDWHGRPSDNGNGRHGRPE